MTREKMEEAAAAAAAAKEGYCVIVYLPLSKLISMPISFLNSLSAAIPFTYTDGTIADEEEEEEEVPESLPLLEHEDLLPHLDDLDEDDVKTLNDTASEYGITDYHRKLRELKYEADERKADEAAGLKVWSVVPAETLGNHVHIFVRAISCTMNESA